MRAALWTLAIAAATAAPALAIDEAHKQTARGLMDKAVAYLRTQQDPATGGWAVSPKGPQFPAITGLAVQGLAAAPGVGPSDQSVARAVKYILSFRQSDGGIYDKVLPCYNTSIC